MRSAKTLVRLLVVQDLLYVLSCAGSYRKLAHCVLDNDAIIDYKFYSSMFSLIFFPFYCAHAF